MHVLWLAAGAATWAVHFALVYGITALACARGLPDAVPWTVAVTGLAAVAVALAVFRRGYRERATFIGWMSAAGAGIALIAVVYESLGIVVLPLCR